MVKASSGVLSEFFGDLRRYQSAQQHGFFDPEKKRYPVNTLLIEYAKPIFYSMEKVNSTDTLDLSSQFKTQQAGSEAEADADLITATEFISANVDDKTRMPNLLDAATTMNERELFAGWKTKFRACQNKIMRAMGVAPIPHEPETRKNTSQEFARSSGPSSGSLASRRGKAPAKAAAPEQGNASHNLGFDQNEIDEAIRRSEEEAKTGRRGRHPSTDKLGEGSGSGMDVLAGSSRQRRENLSSRESADLEQALKKSLTDF